MISGFKSQNLDNKKKKSNKESLTRSDDSSVSVLRSKIQARVSDLSSKKPLKRLTIDPDIISCQVEIESPLPEIVIFEQIKSELFSNTDLDDKEEGESKFNFFNRNAFSP